MVQLVFDAELVRDQRPGSIEASPASLEPRGLGAHDTRAGAAFGSSLGEEVRGLSPEKIDFARYTYF